MPATLATNPIDESAVRLVAMASPTAARSVTSTATVWILWSPAGKVVSTRSRASTVHPDSVRTSAVACPIPLDAPVTTATAITGSFLGFGGDEREGTVTLSQR